MEQLDQAKKALSRASDADELRQLQAVILPLALDLTLAQTARLIGRSVRWTSRARSEYLQTGGATVADRPGKGGRRRQNLTPEEEAKFLEPFFQGAKRGGILVVGEIHRALETRLGRKVPLSSVYNLLHRHGWRKLVPAKRHVSADVELQEEWKKNSGPPSRKPFKAGTKDVRSG
jgi:transposase